jgi:hypothetical protein
LAKKIEPLLIVVAPYAPSTVAFKKSKKFKKYIKTNNWGKRREEEKEKKKKHTKAFITPAEYVALEEETKLPEKLELFWKPLKRLLVVPAIEPCHAYLALLKILNNQSQFLWDTY